MASIAATLPGAIGRRIDDEIYRRRLRIGSAYVCEFPKSGGSWVTSLTSDLLRSRADETEANPRVLHPHWRYDSRYRPLIYVLRDGRDVVISLYFHHVRHLLAPTMWTRRFDRFFRSVLGPGYDLDDVGGNLPPFIESLAERPFGGLLRTHQNRSFLPWPRHVEDWIDRPGVLLVRYEALHSDPLEELRRIRRHLDVEVPDSVCLDVIARNSFAAKTGRVAGVEDRSSFLRKGVVGDWKSWFTKEAGASFEEFAGDALIACGYERDGRWIERLPS
ncbi:MAG TPA: sulfotransferase domain-containing protein [Gaiellaceae bacterium]